MNFDKPNQPRIFNLLDNLERELNSPENKNYVDSLCLEISEYFLGEYEKPVIERAASSIAKFYKNRTDYPKFLRDIIKMIRPTEHEKDWEEIKLILDKLEIYVRAGGKLNPEILGDIESSIKDLETGVFANDVMSSEYANRILILYNKDQKGLPRYIEKAVKDFMYEEILKYSKHVIMMYVKDVNDNAKLRELKEMFELEYEKSGKKPEKRKSVVELISMIIQNMNNECAKPNGIGKRKVRIPRNRIYRLASSC